MHLYNIVNISFYRERGHPVESYESFCGNTEQLLGRELKQQEYEFLEWLYDKYTDEQKSVTNDTTPIA